jgi:thiamine pyrophosphokinase
VLFVPDLSCSFTEHERASFRTVKFELDPTSTKTLKGYSTSNIREDSEPIDISIEDAIAAVLAYREATARRAAGMWLPSVALLTSFSSAHMCV